MASVTLRVLHGADRGKVFEHLTTPVTVGREEGNTIQLNTTNVPAGSLFGAVLMGFTQFNPGLPHSGIGMDEDQLKSALEPFGRVTTEGRLEY